MAGNSAERARRLHSRGSYPCLGPSDGGFRNGEGILVLVLGRRHIKGVASVARVMRQCARSSHRVGNVLAVLLQDRKKGGSGRV